MALDFPANPTNGQVYANYIYDSSITSWRNVNTDTGIGTLNAMGLKNVVPTSVVVGSGSATTNSNGMVTFNAASSISLNGVFTSTYKNYRVITSITNSTQTTTLSFRLRASGTDYSGGQYYFGGYLARANATSGSYTANATTNAYVGEMVATADYTNSILDFFAPQLVQSTGFVLNSVSYATAIAGITGGGLIGTATQYDGITIYPAGGNATGTIQVFGYTN